MERLQRYAMPRPVETRLRNRDVTEILQHRTALLSEKERALMRMHLESGQSIRRIARLIGMNPATISRRIRKIAQRLMDPTYLLCARNRDEFNTLELTVIRDHFVRGQSIAAISRKYDITYYRARAAVHKGKRYVEMNIHTCS